MQGEVVIASLTTHSKASVHRGAFNLYC